VPVPSVVVDEFEPNHPRAEAALSASVVDRFRQLRQDLHEYGSDGRLEWLGEMSHRVPMVSSGTLQNLSEIGDLLRSVTRQEPSSVDFEGTLHRGLDMTAPFHLNKSGARAPARVGSTRALPSFR
jgi:hypothetical protein